MSSGHRSFFRSVAATNCKGEADMAKITVLMEDGRVQNVDGIPIDLYVEVRNYDVGGLPHEVLSKDGNGRACQIREWRAPE